MPTPWWPAAHAQPEVVAAAKRINTGGMISSREGAYPVAITAIEPSVEAPVSIHAENVVAGRYLMDDDLDAVFIGRAWPICWTSASATASPCWGAPNTKPCASAP